MKGWARSTASRIALTGEPGSLTASHVLYGPPLRERLALSGRRRGFRRSARRLAPSGGSLGGQGGYSAPRWSTLRSSVDYTRGREDVKIEVIIDEDRDIFKQMLIYKELMIHFSFSMKYLHKFFRYTIYRIPYIEQCITCMIQFILLYSFEGKN